MKALLMNFGTQTRVIHNSDKIPQVIEIGATKDIDLDEHTARFIEKSQPTDTLMMIPLGDQMPKELSDIASILRDMDEVPYEEILTRAVMLIGKDNMSGLRPSRPELRITLRDIAMQFAHGAPDLAAATQKIAERRSIKDDQEPAKLEQEKRQQDEASLDKRDHPVKKASIRERLDASLGIVGAEGEASAEDLAAETQASETDKAEKQPKPPKQPKAKKQKAAKKEPASFKPKRHPTPARRGGSAGVQRVRA